jgi:hypothetical protein
MIGIIIQQNATVRRTARFVRLASLCPVWPAALTLFTDAAADNRAGRAESEAVNALFAIEARLTAASAILRVVAQILAAVWSAAGFSCVAGFAPRAVTAVARDALPFTDH